jgi:hypothetical protein
LEPQRGDHDDDDDDAGMKPESDGHGGVAGLEPQRGDHDDDDAGLETERGDHGGVAGLEPNRGGTAPGPTALASPARGACRGDDEGSEHQHCNRRAPWKAQPEAAPSPQPLAE